MGTASDTDDIAQRCRVFYERRLQVAGRFGESSQDMPATNQAEGGHSQMGQAMLQLRREIATLMKEDNALFEQLLKLNDKIEELKEQHAAMDVDEGGSRCGSLESLSDAEGTTADQSASPTSTLSSSSSSTTMMHTRPLRPPQTLPFRRTSLPVQRELARPLQIITKDSNGRLVILRSTANYKDNFLTSSDCGVSAYDSGFHGSESDPENNEIFV